MKTTALFFLLGLWWTSPPQLMAPDCSSRTMCIFKLAKPAKRDVRLIVTFDTRCMAGTCPPVKVPLTIRKGTIDVGAAVEAGHTFRSAEIVKDFEALRVERARSLK